jgi:hypothetical protein
MEETKNIKVELLVNSIVVYIDGRRIIIHPQENGILLLFKRLVDTDEKNKLKENPEYKITTSEATLIDNRIIVTNILLTYDTLFALSNVVMTYQREIRIRQILNTIFQNETNYKLLTMLNDTNIDEFIKISDLFENGDYEAIKTKLNQQ